MLLANGLCRSSPQRKQPLPRISFHSFSLGLSTQLPQESHVGMSGSLHSVYLMGLGSEGQNSLEERGIFAPSTELAAQGSPWRGHIWEAGGPCHPFPSVCGLGQAKEGHLIVRDPIVTWPQGVSSQGLSPKIFLPPKPTPFWGENSSLAPFLSSKRESSPRPEIAGLGC